MKNILVTLVLIGSVLTGAAFAAGNSCCAPGADCCKEAAPCCK